MSRTTGAIVFGGDLLHAADMARCEGLWGAAQALAGAQAPSALLVGMRSGQRPGLRQDAQDALRRIRTCRAERPGAIGLFSASDPFSAHLARTLSAQDGAALVATVVGLHADHAVCADAHGLSRRVALAPGQVLLVDERYFLRRPLDPGLCEAGQDDRATAAGAGTDFDVPAGAVALPEAQLILSGGDGVQDWESLVAVAELLGATVGATKVACDKGLQPRARQVGSSGTAVSPRVYLALGISGSTQHLQGIAEAASVLAVNTDPNAAIARRAELLLVADANAVLRALRSTLQAGGRA